jgi:hypothetical protein
MKFDGLSSTVVNDAAEVVCRVLLVLLPHRGRRPQVLRNIGVIGGLSLVALPSQLKQFPPGIAKLAEDGPKRVQALLDRGVRRGDGPQVVGGLLVMSGGFT